ncbi:hypothetical protein J7L24_00655 [bacterium]|nr:hypothetical protein [bacterium]
MTKEYLKKNHWTFVKHIGVYEVWEKSGRLILIDGITRRLVLGSLQITKEKGGET